MLIQNTLLIATYKRLILYHRGEDIGLNRDFEGYSSMTWGHDHIYALARGKEDQDSAYGLVFNSRLELERSCTLPSVRFPHQAIYREAEVLIANCGHNVISAWDRWDAVRTVWSTGRKRIDGDRSTDDHVNSVWYDDRHFYVCEHRNGPSVIRVLDHGWDSVNTWDIGDEIHNVLVEDGMVYVCDSAHDGILRRNLETGEDEQISVADKLGWISEPAERLVKIAYTRGLAKTANRLYVGCSAVTPRGDRKRGDSAIAVFDGEMNYLGKTILEDTGGLGDIRVVDEIDRAHNGLRCPWDGMIPDA